MAKRTFTRRQFLSLSAIGASAYTVSGCSSLNQFFTGDSRFLKEEVIILGAGAAGLSAAFELKKNKIPFRIFEASQRVGGRVHSVRLRAESPVVSELGAEFFQDYHQTTRKLIEELNLTEREVEAVGGVEPQLFYLDSRILKNRDFQPGLSAAKKSFRRVREDLFRNQDVQLTLQNARQFERSAYYDSLNLQELLNSWKREIEAPLLKLIEIQAVNRFGVPAEQQSALMFLSTLNSEGSSLLQTSRNFRLEGGLTGLMNSLAERVSGVIPDRILKLRHELVHVEEKGGVFRLAFKTPHGRETYRTRRVICTIPPSCLKIVSGIAEMDWKDRVWDLTESVELAFHEKGYLLMSQPFWKKPVQGTPATIGNWTGEFKSQKIWNAGRGQETEPALLGYQRVSFSQSDFNTEEQMKNDLSLFYRNLSWPTIESFQNILWKQRQWAKGSMMYYKPGQYTKFNGLLEQGFFEGAWQFAGEHVHAIHHGTLEGALQSGITAARAFKNSVS